MRSIWFWILIVNAAVGTVGTDSYCECSSTGSGTIELIPPFGCDVFYKLDGCNGTGSSVSWPSFKNVVDVSIELKEFSIPPTVTSIFSSWHEGYIDLIWSHDGTEYNCGAGPKPISKSANKFPLQIDPSKTYFQFSNYSTFLFLNCNSVQYPNGIHNSDICESYISACNQSEKYGDCVELEYNKSSSKYPSFFESVSSWNCTHFEVIVNRTGNSWNAGTIELVWWSGNDSICSATDSCKGGNKVAVIAGSAFAASVVVIILAVLVILLLLRRRRYKNGYKTRSIRNSSSSSSNSKKIWSQRAIQLSSKYGALCVKEFHYTDLLQATNDFSDENIVGDGGFGAVYLGILKNDTKVAVKKLYHENFRRMEQFYNEMKILSGLNHPNLVKLFGFCCQDDNELFLVFEYATNGTVFDLLHESECQGFPLNLRINIAWETANALSYLHNSLNPPIYHRDVKTTNILLDEGFHAKLADFGLSRLVPLNQTHISTAPQGTPGYLDPEYHESYQLTDKSDVFSFGVVLMELVSGLLAVDLSRSRKEINLSSLAMAKIKSGAWKDLVDPRLEMEKHPEYESIIRGVIEVAFMCLHGEKDSRPNMKEVVETLARLRGERHVDLQSEEEIADLMKSGRPLLQGNHQNDETKSGTNSMASSMWSSSKADDNSFSF